MDLLISDDTIALHAMDMYSKYFPLIRALSGNRSEARDAFGSAWVAIFGRPERIQVDEEGEWGNEVRADFRAGRRMKFQFHEDPRGPSSQTRIVFCRLTCRLSIVGGDREAVACSSFEV